MGVHRPLFLATKNPDALSKMAHHEVYQRHYTTRLDDIIEVIAG